MNNSNIGGPTNVVRLKPKKRYGLKSILVAGVAFALFLHFTPWFDIWPLRAVDAGPTQAVVAERDTYIEAIDFGCHLATTSVFQAHAYNPGWHPGIDFWFIDYTEERIQVSNQGVIKQFVGDVDICVWAEDTDIEVDESSLLVTINEFDARRPRIDYAQRVLGGEVVQTHVTFVDTHFTKRNKDMGALELEEMLDGFAQSTLDQSACLDDAYGVVEESLRKHYQADAELLGLTLVLEIVPTSLEFEYQAIVQPDDDLELQILEEERCHITNWNA